MQSRPPRNVSYLILCAVALVAIGIMVTTAIRIEVINARAGHILPRTGEVNDAGELTKWRLHPSPSTPREQAENQLRGCLETWGALQHPLAMVTMLVAFPVLGRMAARRGSLPVMLFVTATSIVAIAAMILALYRGYWSSLGW